MPHSPNFKSQPPCRFEIMIVNSTPARCSGHRCLLSECAYARRHCGRSWANGNVASRLDLVPRLRFASGPRGSQPFPRGRAFSASCSSLSW